MECFTSFQIFCSCTSGKCYLRESDKFRYNRGNNLLQNEPLVLFNHAKFGSYTLDDNDCLNLRTTCTRINQDCKYEMGLFCNITALRSSTNHY